MSAIGRQKFAPRQLLLRCPNKLHPYNDAISALPPSLAVEAVILKSPNSNLKQHPCCNSYSHFHVLTPITEYCPVKLSIQ